ncbi:hypothetical protein JMJ35_009652 [Cladonia borealis]|uniref:Rhodopsin domain-containing protein n=1 Tax=Cladonia borealis TaxID=184061 RepID=A0AA39UXL7_9LECA|nr:hypothetical protein JMJ35_009652 [Cladonia borealis]
MKEQIFARPETGDTNRGWAVLAVCWAFVACAFISTVLRVWVRVRLTRNMGPDDFNMIAAMTTTLIGVGLITTEVINGLGRHEYCLTPSQRRNTKIIGWVDWMQTFITLMLTKTSICLFLLRIVDSRKIKIAIYALIGCLITFTTICVCLFLGVCRPLKAYWDVGVDGICLSDHQLESVVLAQGILSIISDLICAAFPVLFLRNLQIKMRTKVALCVLMGLGVITAACCTVRTVLSGAITDPDITWAIIPNVGWRLPEVNIGIVCANAPILRPLYLYFQGRLQTQKASSTAISKERMAPNNVNWSDSTKLQDSLEWNGLGESHSSADHRVSLEMGLPRHWVNKEQV